MSRKKATGIRVEDQPVLDRADEALGEALDRLDDHQAVLDAACARATEEVNKRFGLLMQSYNVRLGGCAVTGDLLRKKREDLRRLRTGRVVKHPKLPKASVLIVDTNAIITRKVDLEADVLALLDGIDDLIAENLKALDVAEPDAGAPDAGAAGDAPLPELPAEDDV